MRPMLALLSLTVLVCLADAESHYLHRKLDWFTDTPWVWLMDDGGILYGGTKDDPELPEREKTYDLYLDGVNYTAELFSGRHQVTGGQFEADGNLWFHAYFWDEPGGSGSHLFRNKTNYTAQRYGRQCGVVGPWILNSRGDLAITLQCPGDGNDGYDVWLNDRNVTLEVFGPNRFRDGAPAILFESGDMFWAGSSPGWTPRDVYLNDSNLSEPILGSNRVSQTVYANSPSDYVFAGSGSKTSGYQNVFKGTENYGARVFGSVRYEARLLRYSKNGHIVWAARGEDPFAPSDIYRDEVNLSSLLGDGRYVGYHATTAADGRVMWQGWAPYLGLEYYDVFVDQTNISGPRLGWDPTRRGDAHGFTSSGRAVWMGYTATDGWNVFLDDVNVTENAFEGVPGRRWVSRMGVAANARGDVLWIARTPDYYAGWEVWYSELVPEPSTALLIAAGIAAMTRRGWRRARSQLTKTRIPEP